MEQKFEKPVLFEYIVPYSQVSKSRGVLSETNTDIRIHRFGKTVTAVKAHKLAREIRHPNYLRVHFVDDSHYNIAHESISLSLEDYKAQIGEPLKQYKVPEGCQPPSPPKVGAYFYIVENYRLLIRGVLRFLEYLHFKKFSFYVPEKSSLKLSENFVVVDKEVKFWHVGFQAASHDTIKRDYKLISEVIDKLIPPDPRLPEDMQHLKRTLSGFARKGPPKSPALLSAHLAVQPSFERITQIRDMVELYHLATGGDHFAYETAVDCLPPWYNTWARDFLKKPQFIPVKNCFNHPRPNGKAYELSEGAFGDKLKFLGFCRNLVVHLPEHFRKDDLINVQPSPLDSDCMIMKFAGEMLVDFQSNLTNDLVEMIHKFERGH